MTRKEQIKLIREAYAELSYLNLQDGFYDVADRLLDMNVAAEKQHRTGRPAQPLTVKDAAKLFTVSHLLDGYNAPCWTINDILHVRTERLYAQAYANRFIKELASWVLKYSEDFKQVDYAQLMKEDF